MNTQDQPTHFSSVDPHALEGEDDISLGEMIANLWEGRYLVVGATILALLLGVFYAWRKTPIYQVDALLQIEDKKAGKGGPAMAALEGLFDQPTVAQAEIEILGSNLVLGRAVEALSLDIVSTPDFGLLFGDALVRYRNDAPELLVDRFEVASHLRGQRFTLIALDGNRFKWEGPKGEELGEGQPGEILQIVYQGQPTRLLVRRLVGPPGQKFILARQPILQVIASLRADLKIAEKGKQTNIIGLNFNHRNPVRGAEILNEIVGQYVHQNIERKAEEASKTLAFLQEQMPQLRGKLDVAEERLNQYRMRSGSVDLSEEAKLVLRQGVDLDGQIVVLKQKRQELLRTYKEGADVVSTLDQQIAKLAAEAGEVDKKVRELPRTQQEFVRLMREVQVNTDLYTALLNNAQQLQVARAGEIGNARIVDHAWPSLRPITPQKANILVLSGLLGISFGVGLVIVRKALNRGVEDPRIIESRLGLPVLVTVPHSNQQLLVQRAMSKGEKGMHLLVEEFPGDMAVESLRSLRTSLHFTMMDAPNKVVLISGPSPSIGKTFVSSNFAALLAHTGMRVLLVDGDMRKGFLHLPFGFSHREHGLSEVLAGDQSWESVIRHTSLTGLDLITTGTLPPNPSELLMTKRMPAFVQQVSAAYDLVILDAPPVLAVTDPVILASQVGTVLLLAKSKTHPLDEIRTAVQRFEHAGIKVKGCIFNDVPEVKVGYRNYRYAYHYGYKK